MDDGEGCLAVLRLLAAAPLPQRELARRLADGELGRTLRLLARSRLVSRTVDPSTGGARSSRSRRSAWPG
ncbi:hypothetical protein ACFQV2_23400 [Actinokineospora soli]|uniref:MarR family protein n=1 Tax=Actinokineospora soli TaxID=1048753 RepID=A0ABW2TT55_9PSEU